MASTSSSGAFEFSLENGLALIMTAGGASACGNNFVAGRDDVVFKVWGNYTMTIDDNNNVTICLTDMYSLIFANKANYSSWFYFDTLWARAWSNCIPIHLDVGLSRQAHGGWTSSNTSGWKRAIGYKGGTGIRGYDQWIKYRGEGLEADCAGEYVGTGCCGAGSYIGSKKKLPDLCWSLGQVDFNSSTGFWIGANLGSYEGGWEQWQFVSWPIIIFEAPAINVENEVLDICHEVATIDIVVSSASSFATGGGTWEMQISQNSDFSNALSYSTVNGSNSVTFSGIEIAAGTKYYIRSRLKVSSIRYSNWAETSYKTTGTIPDPSAMVEDVTDMECFYVRHGVLIEGGVVE